jgi:hypothetical protein
LVHKTYVRFDLRRESETTLLPAEVQRLHSKRVPRESQTSLRGNSEGEHPVQLRDPIQRALMGVVER